jgi:pimeloyl-ACP methyl ester carboxylesterase
VTETQIFEPDRRAIAYVDEGEGPVTLVLIPEPGLERDALAVIGHYLAEEAGFRVVRIGSRDAAGASSGEVTLDDRVGDVADVLDHLGLSGTWIGGHGFGGTVARAFGAEHAGRLNGLLLLGVQEQSIPLPPAIPVLIIQGAEDEITPPVQGDLLQSTAPERASVTTLRDAGHLFPLTHPIETAVLIEEYLDWD